MIEDSCRLERRHPRGLIAYLGAPSRCRLFEQIPHSQLDGGRQRLVRVKFFRFQSKLLHARSQVFSQNVSVRDAPLITGPLALESCTGCPDARRGMGRKSVYLVERNTGICCVTGKVCARALWFVLSPAIVSESLCRNRYSRTSPSAMESAMRLPPCCDIFFHVLWSCCVRSREVSVDDARTRG